MPVNCKKFLKNSSHSYFNRAPVLNGSGTELIYLYDLLMFLFVTFVNEDGVTHWEFGLSEKRIWAKDQ